VIALLFIGGFSFVLALLIIMSLIGWVNRTFTKRQMRGEEPMNYFQKRVYGEESPVKKTRAPRAKKTRTTRKKL